MVVLAAIDDTDGAATVLDEAGRLAADLDEDLHAVHVIERSELVDGAVIITEFLYFRKPTFELSFIVRSENEQFSSRFGSYGFVSLRISWIKRVELAGPV